MQQSVQIRLQGSSLIATGVSGSDHQGGLINKKQSFSSLMGEKCCIYMKRGIVRIDPTPSPTGGQKIQQWKFQAATKKGVIPDMHLIVKSI